jgi:membrane-anchored protein YejM (alkaline phosphatase superfamily)
MSEIIATANEMLNISSELKRLRLETQKLNKRKKEIESQILDYLKKKDEPGFKYQNVAVITEEKDIRQPKKKKDKMKNALDVLEENGVRNADKVLKDLIESLKGSPVTETKLRIKDSNSKNGRRKKD